MFMFNQKISDNNRIYLLIILWILSISLYSCQENDLQTGWDAVPDIIRKITLPTFPDRDYLVTNFGAAGNFKTKCRESFQTAINRCNQEGGGRVVVPKGIYLINGPIHLKSNVNLYLSEESILEFSSNPRDYLPMVLSRWEGTELFNYSPFIYAYQATNVAITGKGVIDGNAEKSFALWKQLQKRDKKLLRQMGNDGVPLYERVFGEGHYLRPGMIQLLGCKNILIEGITIIDSPFWVIHPALCINVTVRNVTVDSWNPNNDGVDPDGCVNVLIENCVFNCGDDAVAIKSGRDQDGWRIGQPTENVVIRNCRMNSKANGLCIGSEMSGGVRNVYLEDCQLGEAQSTIYFKSNLDRGGIIENIFVRNIEVKRAKTAVIRFESNYKGQRGNYFPPLFRNFQIENITCQRADHYGIYAAGIKEHPISDVIIKDVIIKKAEIPVFTQYVSNIQLVNVMINDSIIFDLSSYQVSPEADKKITW